MRKDRRWIQNPMVKGFALLGAFASMLWAWRVSMEDMEVNQRAERLRSPSADERIGALAELALLVSVQSEHTAAAFPVVLEATRDPNPLVRAQAVVALSDVARPLTQGGLDAVARQVARTTMLDLVRDPSPEVRVAAVSSLARIGPVPSEALQVLVKLASDRNDIGMRSVAIERLSQMERQTPEALAVIHAALDDTAPLVRASAVSSLGPWVATDSRAARAVFARLGDPDPSVRSSAQGLFLRTGLIPPPETVPDLIALLDLPDVAPGTVAAVVLPRMGNSAETAAPLLLSAIQRALRSGQGLGRFSVHLNALLQFGTEGPVGRKTRDLLCHCLLGHPEPGSRQFAALCLSRYRQHAADSLPALQEARKDPDEEVREAVQRAIHRIEAAQKTAALRSAS